jgi:hypothetical protein
VMSSWSLDLLAVSHFHSPKLNAWDKRLLWSNAMTSRGLGFVFAFSMLPFSCATAVAELIVNGSFEVIEETVGSPTSYGDWGDNLSEIGPAELGISPLDGSHMLQLIATTSIGPDPGARGATVYQPIDVSRYADLIASGKAQVGASAHFNRVMGNAQTDTVFELLIGAYVGDVANFSSANTIALSRTTIFTDGFVDTWERAEGNLLLPPETSFVAVGLSAVEDVFNNPPGQPEFDGHYADLVSVTIPEPPALVLLAAGAAGLAAVRRKQSRHRSS